MIKGLTMRKIFLLSAAGAALILGGASGAMAETLNIKLKGYCDTFTLNVDGSAIYGTHNACTTPLVVGGAVARIGRTYLMVNDTFDGGSDIYTYYFTEPNHNKGMVYVYEETASGVAEVAATHYRITSEDEALVPEAGNSIVARH
jgi:hypothetical protein